MMPITNSFRVLIAKTTQMGDVVISLPMAASLKQHFPGITVLFLTQLRNLEVAARCLDVDEAYALPDNFAELVHLLIKLKVDVFIQANTSEMLGKAAKEASIPMRIGSFFRWHDWRFCNRRVAISRNRKHLNKRLLDLEYLRPLGINGHTMEELSSMCRFSQMDATRLMARIGLNLNKRRIILHPALITSYAHQWPLSAYRELMHAFDKQNFQWIITGTEKDRILLEPLLAKDSAIDKVDTVGQLTLGELITLMQNCDGLVAGSTGPVHLAAALELRVLGFYQSDFVVTKRWAPVGKSVTLLQSDTPCIGHKYDRKCPCVQNISPVHAQAVISEWFGGHDLMCM